ncbi:hypothetical protein LNV23_02850 [Paucibacter sp. DJ1R-11]|uniref:hypothetical protein n=1 Tax=Paucibacter sp. DJ1R-11 TaxID=2893556 RepID=UPI0021E4591B|nr:hypothetical protein [Paucibacter sp. DJ1R-11]MCV2362385.1 hypothetical protein [Paucibacter sp. DJ1R-11]
MSEPKANTVGPRQIVLAAGLAVSVAAALWVAQSEREDADLAQPVAATRRSPAPGAPTGGAARLATTTAAATAAASAAPTDWAPAERGAWAPSSAGQFAAWAPPAPPPPPPAPPPSPPPPPAAPVAPPFPYQLIGRLVEGSGSVALLSSASKTLAVKPGEVIDGQWRVDQIHERGLDLTWLPAKLTQSVNFRAATP